MKTGPDSVMTHGTFRRVSGFLLASLFYNMVHMMGDEPSAPDARTRGHDGHGGVMLGPRRQPDAEPEQIDREVAEWAGTGAAKAAYQLGHEEATTPEAGYAVGHDVGLS